MSYFLETLKLSTKKIISEFAASKQVWHNASAGMIREKIIKRILLPYLPECYGVCSGLCVDANEKESRQLDIIIYDKTYSYRLPFDDDFIVFPCESVYGNIEVKTMLNSQTLEESIYNIMSLKGLSREPATEFNFTPQCELRVNGRQQGTIKNLYFGVVFAFESISIDNIMKKLSEVECQNTVLLPDVIILLDKQTVIFKANSIVGGSDVALELQGKAEGYIPIFTGEDTIAYLILYLLTVLYHTNLKAFNPTSVFCNDVLRDKGEHIHIKNFTKILKIKE